MDGIFGVGLAEILIVGLALFVVGGPKNTAKWARDLGRMVRKAREAWAQVMAEMEAELGPEGKEIMDAARELGKGAREVAVMSPTKRLAGETLRLVESAVDIEDNTADVDAPPSGQADESAPPSPPGESDSSVNEPKYTAWVPPQGKR